MLKIILVLLAIQQLTVAVPLETAVDSAEQRSNMQRHKDCSIILNIDQSADDDTPRLLSVAMPPLQELITERAGGKPSLRSICNLVFAVQPTVLLNGQTKPIQDKIPQLPVTTKAPFTSLAVTTATAAPFVPVVTDNYNDLTQPIYEQQLAVWPSDDILEVIDTIHQIADTQPPIAAEEGIIHPLDELPVISGIAQTVASPQIPIYEDQLVVFPALDVNEDDQGNVVITTTPRPSTAEGHIKIIENIQKIHANGTSEQLLVLSNGVVNYKKIYQRLVNGEIVNVQEGYDSIPLQGQKDKVQTQYYISDENGHQVYKVEQSHRRLS